MDLRTVHSASYVNVASLTKKTKKITLRGL
jgi:hypothetical protein